MGLLFAVAYAVCLGRVGGVRRRQLALLVGLGGFLGMYLVPFLKYPAAPPAIGHPDTIRGGLHLLMVVCSVLLLLGVVLALLPSFGELSASVREFGHQATDAPVPLTDAHGTIVCPGIPADVLLSFRRYSFAAQLLLWGGLALVFAPVAGVVSLRPGAAA